MENNNWYNTGEPFNLEVEITDDSMRKTVEDIVLRSVMKGTELLPGLKVNKAYKQPLDRRDVLSSEMKNDFTFLMESFQEAFDEFFKKWNKDEHPELIGAVKPDGHFNVWPSFTNCIRNCKKCFAKCLYRKEENPEQSVKKQITVKPEDIKPAKKLYDGGWVDMEDKNAVQNMFDSIKI